MDAKKIVKMIDQELREDGYHYTFDDLVDRWEDAFNEAVEEGDQWVTIKIPSGSEFTVSRKAVAVALGR